MDKEPGGTSFHELVGQWLALPLPALKAYRWSRSASVLMLLGLGLWLLIFMLILKDTNNLSSRLDPLIWFAQLFGVVAFFG